ncbi:MAG: tetratricopeptide repeat protein [Magnetococcales bacterium]|nr:tetratricopeptide repeat protein [Magnetococcales bacterium]
MAMISRLVFILASCLVWTGAGGAVAVWAAGAREVEQGVAAQKRGEFEAAEGHYAAALTARDLPRATEAEVWANLCLVRLELGQRHRNREQFAAGLEACNRAVLMKPDLANAYLFRGNGRLAADQVDLAADDFKVAALLAPKDPLPAFFRARALSRLGKVGEAIQSLDAVLKLRPDYAPALLERGLLYDQRGELPRALRDLDQAIRHDAAFHDAFYFRSGLLGRLGRVKEALADIDRALQLRPDNPPALFRRGLFQIAIGEIAAGVATFEQARGMAPTDPNVPVGLGFARFIQGDYEAAATAFRQGLELTPEDPFVHLWLTLTRLRQDPAALASAGTQDEVKEEELTRWPNPLRALLIGRLTPADVLAHAAKAEKTGKAMVMAEASFFIGADHLVHGRTAEAATWFRKNLALDAKDPILAAIIHRELNRLSVVVSVAHDENTPAASEVGTSGSAASGVEGQTAGNGVGSGGAGVGSAVATATTAFPLSTSPVGGAEGVAATAETNGKGSNREGQLAVAVPTPRPLMIEPRTATTPINTLPSSRNPAAGSWPRGESPTAVSILLTDTPNTDVSAIVRYFRSNGLGDEVARLHIFRTGGDRTLVYFGTFPDIATAQARIDALPAILRKNAPIIQSMARIERRLSQLIATPVALDSE